MPSTPAGKARLEARIETRCNGSSTGCSRSGASGDLWEENIMAQASAKVLEDGAHRYEVIEDWGTLPPGWSYGEVAAVGVDSRDNVFVFARGEHPMIVFDREG